MPFFANQNGSDDDDDDDAMVTIRMCRQLLNQKLVACDVFVSTRIRVITNGELDKSVDICSL